MKKLEATQTQPQEIEVNDFVGESASRIEVPRIQEQLKRISELKIDNFTKLSGAKFESTVQEMFSIIKDLEGHLRDVLTLNATLKEEVRDKRKIKEELLREKETVKQKIASLERDFPLVQDLERKMDIAVAEVDKFRTLYKQEKEKLEKIAEENKALVFLNYKVREERDDAYREIVVMGDKIKSLTKVKQ